MAMTLRPGSTPEAGKNNPKIDPDVFWELNSDLDDAESDLASARAKCKEPKQRVDAVWKRIKSEIGLIPFTRAREDSKLPGVERELNDLRHRQIMAEFYRKPLGYQTDIEIDIPEDDVGYLKSVDNQGHEAGINGHNADTNPFTPGTESFARFASAWLRGQKELVERQHAEGPSEVPPSAKRRGRPRKDQTPVAPPPQETKPNGHAEGDPLLAE